MLNDSIAGSLSFIRDPKTHDKYVIGNSDTLSKHDLSCPFRGFGRIHCTVGSFLKGTLPYSPQATRVTIKATNVFA